MFIGCFSLEKLNLSNFDRNNVSLMGNMFGDCCKLRELNISNFSSKNLYNIEFMFSNCTLLSELIVNNNFIINDKVKTLGITLDCPKRVDILVKNKFKIKEKCEAICVIN